MEGLNIRTLLPSDVERVTAITRESREAARWSVADFKRVAAEVGAGVQAWVAEQGEAVVGYLVMRAVSDEVEILNLAVAPPARRQGIASALIRKGLSAAEAGGARRVFLEVRESNHAAATLYVHHEFRPSGKRRDYYREPVEDALILTRDLRLSPDKGNTG